MRKDVGKVCSNSFGNSYFGASLSPCGRRCWDKSGTRARGCGKCGKSALSWPCPVGVYRRDTASTTNAVASRMNSTLLRGCLNLASCAPTFASPLRPRPIGSLRLLRHFLVFLAIYLFSFRFLFHSFSLLASRFSPPFPVSFREFARAHEFFSNLPVRIWPTCPNNIRMESVGTVGRAAEDLPRLATLSESFKDSASWKYVARRKIACTRGITRISEYLESFYFTICVICRVSFYVRSFYELVYHA